MKLYRNGLPTTLCQDEFEKTMEAYHLIKVVPKPIDIIFDRERIGAIYQKINGKTMLKKMVEKPWRFTKYAKQLAIYHADIQKPVKSELPSVKM